MKSTNPRANVLSMTNLSDDDILDLCTSDQRRVLHDVVVTPNLAAALLALNTANRPVRRSHVAFLAREIVEGRWRRTHQGIAMGGNGILLDGQHRLQAVIETGHPLTSDLHFGLDPSTFAVIDTHSRREAADVLALQGVENSKRVAAVIRLLIGITGNANAKRGAARNRKASNEEVMAEMGRWPHIVEICSLGGRIQNKVRGFRAGAIAGSCLIAKRVKYDELRTFLTRVETGLDAKSEDDPAYRLRNTLISAPPSLRNEEIAAYVVKAWNAYRARRPLKVLRWISSEAFPVVTV